jgi:hypothetical protein
VGYRHNSAGKIVYEQEQKMRKVTKTVATWLGLTGGIAGMGHGYFEILQGSTKPPSMMILSMGPPCVPEEVWNACEPAMTIIPNYLVTGILAVVVGLLTIIWSMSFIQRAYGGITLMILSVISLLFGGGFFPPLIGMIGGVAGMKINQPVNSKQAGGWLGSLGKLWPWPLIIFLVWVFGQIVVGHFFNAFMKSIMGFGLILILVMLPLSVFSANARDVSLVHIQ